MKTKIGLLGGCLVAMFATGGQAFAGIVVTNLGSDQYLVQLDPITFTVTSNQSAANRMVVEDFWTTNQTSSGIDISGNLNLSINGATPFSISFETNNGGFNGVAGQVDQNDLLFNYTIDYATQGVGGVSAGDLVTLSTTDMIFQATPARVPNTGTFTAHLLNGVTSIATATVTAGSVPAPATLALLGLGLAGVGYQRRKNKAM